MRRVDLPLFPLFSEGCLISHRRDQVASQIQRAVQTVIGRGLHDPRVRGLVSVTKVDVDGALKNAAIYVSVLPDEYAELTIRGLQHAAPRMQSQLAKAVRMRRTPKLTFHVDQSLKKQAEFDAALAEARVAEEDEQEEGNP